METIKFKATVEDDGTYTAKAINYPIFTEGNTYKELKANIEEAVICHFGKACVLLVEYDGLHQPQTGHFSHSPDSG